MLPIDDLLEQIGGRNRPDRWQVWNRATLRGALDEGRPLKLSAIVEPMFGRAWPPFEQDDLHPIAVADGLAIAWDAFTASLATSPLGSIGTEEKYVPSEKRVEPAKLARLQALLRVGSEPFDGCYINVNDTGAWDPVDPTTSLELSELLLVFVSPAFVLALYWYDSF